MNVYVVFVLCKYIYSIFTSFTVNIQCCSHCTLAGHVWNEHLKYSNEWKERERIRKKWTNLSQYTHTHTSTEWKNLIKFISFFLYFITTVCTFTQNSAFFMCASCFCCRLWLSSWYFFFSSLLLCCVPSVVFESM